MKPNKAIIDALKVTAYGAGTVLLSTITSCAMAVVVERAAHRTLYRFFPDWYSDVKYANGLPHLQHRNTEGDDNTYNNNHDDQIAEDIGPIEAKIENFETIHQPDTQIENSFITTITSMISPLNRETETQTRNVEPFWNSEEVLRRIKYNLSATTTATSSSSSQFETYANTINKKSERLSIDVHNCAMTTG